MPSGEPKVPEQGFRRRVVGGFDENDVLAYVNELVNESQQQQMEYEEQIRQLQGQIDKLKKEQANARTCVEKLQDELLQQTRRAGPGKRHRRDLRRFGSYRCGSGIPGRQAERFCGGHARERSAHPAGGRTGTGAAAAGPRAADTA